MRQKVLIIDGHNFLFRGFYGVPVSAVSKDGSPINAIYGFFSLLRLTINKIHPDFVLVIFDSESSIKSKQQLVPEYKLNRKVANDVYAQLPMIKRCLELINIPWLDDLDYEADDLIGVYTTHFTKNNYVSYIASSDKDFMQLISDYVYVVRGIHGNIDVVNESKMIEKYNITPAQYVAYLALVGDPSDNIKGVKGIGKNRALKILSGGKKLEDIFLLIDTLPPNLNLLVSMEETRLKEISKILEIKKNIEMITLIDIEKYPLIPNSIPDQMGKFLFENWQDVK